MSGPERVSTVTLGPAERWNTTGRTGIAWRPAWAWGRETELLLRRLLEDAPRPVVHAGCGASPIGDLRLDALHPSADVHADSRALPLRDRSAGTVLMDPPWTIKDLVERQRWIKEAGRVLRDDGLFVLHAPWMPSPGWGALDMALIRHQTSHRLPGPPVVITVWRVSRGGGR